jgi:hypothetical protein
MTDKYIFRREFTDLYGSTTVVEHTIQEETLDEIILAFQYFLNGCSFTYLKELDYTLHGEQKEPTEGDLNQIEMELEEFMPPDGC